MKAPSVITEKLKDLNLDAYIIYDFRKSNFIGRQILDFSEFTTRKWVAIFKKDGSFKLLLPAIEKTLFEHFEADKDYFAGYADFNKLIEENIKGLTNVALDYSEENNVAVGDIVPAGFVELLRKLNPNIKISSAGDLTQYVSSLWGEVGYNSHVEASNHITEVKDLAYELIEKSLKDNKPITDYDVRMFIINEFHQRNVHADEDICIVSTNERTGNAHYWPTKENNYVIEKNSVLLFDIWGKMKTEGAVYSDSTFMAWIGPDNVKADVQKVWDIVKTARDIGIEVVMNNYKNDLRGWQVDRAVRDHIIKHGYEKNFIHRTGHSIDVNDHGSGADMDDFEKHDTRRVLNDTGFSIEPGIYLPEFGVRSEINIYMHPTQGPLIKTFKQEELKIINI